MVFSGGDILEIYQAGSALPLCNAGKECIAFMQCNYAVHKDTALLPIDENPFKGLQPLKG